MQSAYPAQVRTEQLSDTAGILQGRAGDRKAWVSAVLAANWAAAAKAREALSAALPEAQRGRADADAALYAEPQVGTSCSGDGGDRGLVVSVSQIMCISASKAS